MVRSASVLALALLGAAVPAPAAREAAVASFEGPVQPDPGSRPAADRRGKVVAFEASFRENGDRYDAAATPTVFLWDRGAGTLRQVAASGPCDRPSVAHLSAYARVGTALEKSRFSRTLVAFRSTANLAGRNADGSPEIFVWDSQTNGFTQVTDALSGESSFPAIGAAFHPGRKADGSYDGTLPVRYRVAFLSTSDLTGDNPAGLPQVFLFDSGIPDVGRLVQVSHSTTGAAGPPVVDQRGSRVAFVHDGDVIPGPAVPGVYGWTRERGLERAPLQGPLLSGTEPCLDARGRFLAMTAAVPDPATGSPAGTGVLVVDLRRGRGRFFLPSTPFTTHRAPSLGRGRTVLCLSTDPGDGSPEVPERPVLLRGPRRLRETGLPAGPYGTLALQSDRRHLLLTTTQDLDGTNASGREVLFRARLRR